MRKHFTIRYVFFFITILNIAFLCSCEKSDENGKNPEMNFVSGIGLVDGDISLPVGFRFRISINATAGSNNLTYFNIALNTGSTNQTYLDSGLNTSALSWSNEFIKTTADKDTWIFTVMDRARKKNQIQITISKSPVSQYGAIKYISSVKLGAQSNTQYPNFLSLSNDSLYWLAEAFQRQELIDIIYYYHSLYLGTMSSPNEADAPIIFTGQYGISNWTTKNETRYDTTLITSSQFDAAANDSLLLEAFDPVNGKRKAKYLQPGMVVSFVTARGKIGLFKVLNIIGGETGYVEISIKVQQ